MTSSLPMNPFPQLLPSVHEKLRVQSLLVFDLETPKVGQDRLRIRDVRQRGHFTIGYRLATPLDSNPSAGECDYERLRIFSSTDFPRTVVGVDHKAICCRTWYVHGVSRYLMAIGLDRV